MLKTVEHLQGDQFFRSTRLDQALRQPPLAGVIFDPDQNTWSELFSRSMQKVEQVCTEKQICSHDLAHVLRVAENAFFLKDLWDVTCPDEVVILPCLIHDMGYLLKRIQWCHDSKTALDHALQGSLMLDVVRRVFLPSHISPEYQASLQLLKEHAHLFFYSISGGLNNALAFSQYLEKYEDRNLITDLANITVLSTQLADKLDYFFAERVRDLKQPSTYQANPYYFLCQAVERYELRMQRKTLQYVIKFNEDQQFTSVQHWITETRQHGYDKIWQLAESYCRLLGLQFEIVEDDLLSSK